MKCNLKKILLRWRVQSAAARDQAPSDMTSTPNAPAQTAVSGLSGAVTPTSASKGSHSHVSNLLYVLNYRKKGGNWGGGGGARGSKCPSSIFGTELRGK